MDENFIMTIVDKDIRLKKRVEVLKKKISKINNEVGLFSHSFSMNVLYIYFYSC